jgi:hypothetical protein
MTERPLGARRRQRRAAAWIVASVVGGGACAQSARELGDVPGFKAGPVVIAPSLTAGYSYNTNVLQQSEAASPQPDSILTLQPALQLTAPFSNSMFRFADVFTYFDYKNTPQTNGKTSNDAIADLTLNFGSRHQLELSAHNVAGVAETLDFDTGGEAEFKGNSFQLHSEAVSLSREVGGARGYRLALARNAVRFDPSITVNFFNYRGFDGEAAYLQPLSPNTRLSFGYLGARYDHADAAQPSTVSRTETGDTVYGQVEGQLGPRQPYSVRLGWERLAFAGPDENEGDDFAGVVGQAKLSAIVGGGTMFTVMALRQPYRSNVDSNNYYVFDLIGGWVERIFPQGSSVGGDLALSMNSYNEPIREASYLRQDRRVQLEAYANLALAKRVIFRVSLARNRRYSNAPGAGYNETVAFGGFVLGWI